MQASKKAAPKSALYHQIRITKSDMKRASNSSTEHSKKLKVTSSGVADSLNQDQEDGRALKFFAEWKASARTATREELDEVVAILRRRKVSEMFEPDVSSLMPEIYCLLKVLSQKAHRGRNLSVRLPFIFVSASRWS
jgi:hypothetical protein